MTRLTFSGRPTYRNLRGNATTTTQLATPFRPPGVAKSLLRKHQRTKAGGLSFISMALEELTWTDTSGSASNGMESVGVSQWVST